MASGDAVQKDLNPAGVARPAPGRWLPRVGGMALTLGAVVAVLALCWLLRHIEANDIITQQQQREVVRVSLLAELLRSELRPVASDLRLLADGDGLRRFVDTGADDALQAMIRRASFISASHPDYSQVRYIDENGREVMRVDQGGRLVPADQLQNRADRPYFQQTSTLAPGSLYVSALDLNVEQGRLVLPHQPMLRLAVPVFDRAGQRRGIYIVDLLGANLISRLQEAAGTMGHRLRMLDSSGHWVKAADPAMEWGSSLPERAGFSPARTEPALWSSILASPDGEHRGENLFTWQRVAVEEIAGPVSGQLLSDAAFFVVASEVSAQEQAALVANLDRVMLQLAAGLVLLTLCSAWLFRGRHRAMRALRDANQQLEDRVRERTAALAASNEQLRHREVLLEETGHLAKVGGWEFDPVTGAGAWTPEIARIHDLDITVQPSKELGLQFYPGESRTRLEAALEKSLLDGTPYDLELEFVSARGEPKWVRTMGRPLLENGRVVRMRGALQDVTDHKRAELRLQAQLQRLNLLERTTRAIGERQDLGSILQVVIRTLEEQMPLDFGCVCLYDPADRTLTVAAVGIASMGLAEELAMPQTARIPIDENGLSRCVRGQLVYEEDIGGSQFPFPQRLAAGGLRAMVVAPLQIESQVFGVLVAARRQPQSFSSGDCEFLRQMSEHAALAAHQAQLLAALQAAYEDLRNTQQSILQQERLRVLGQMASGIAHDINNAISPIMLYTESLLEREPGLSDTARQNLLIIQQAVSDVAETVARMREFYRQREAQTTLQPVLVNALVTQLRELTRARWETIPQQHGIVINLQLELAEKLPAVQGMESEMREALTNLIFNAVDAMPQGGTLTLRTRPLDARRVCVEVIDTGAGMDETTLRRCLEPFFTTKGERGTGLGLAMVYGVMQRHGGEIEIDSTAGSGTTMRLCFMATEAQPGPRTAAAVEVPRELDLLLIDDDPILLNSLREILQLDGHRIRIANGGQAGIDLFHASLQPGGSPVDLVITDLGMPHVDGRRVASAIKLASPATPVVLLTGWGERLLAEGHAPPHVDRVLSKPPRLRDLRLALAELAGTRARSAGNQSGPAA